jgi:WD40 repeat protein
LWGVASGKEIGDPMRGHGGLVVAVAFVGDVIVSGGNEHTMRLWDGSRGQPLSRPISNQSGPVTDVAISPDGAEIAAAGTDSSVRLWNVDTGTLVDSMPEEGHTGVVTSVAFSPVDRGPAERLVASAGSDGTVALWRPGSKEVRKFDAGRPLTSVAFSPTGARVAAAGVDGQIVEWNVASGAPTSLENRDNATVTAIAFAPDDRLASVSVSGTLRMWRADGSQAWEAKPAKALPGDLQRAEQLAQDYPEALSAVAFSPIGKTVATGGANWTIAGTAAGFVQFWNSADGTDAGSSFKVGLGVMDIAFNPADDHGLVVASFDPYQVQVWNTQSPAAPRYTFAGHEAQVVSVAASKDGRIVSGSVDGNVRVWPNLPAGPASDAICAKLTSSMTEATWRQWVSPDLPLRQTCPSHDTGAAKPK